jgi:hypothetical protein
VTRHAPNRHMADTSQPASVAGETESPEFWSRYFYSG